ncbi:MAG: penicillin-binding transpeptidase domain-containing protein [Oscillospiraceae bacterium]|nr:penicillin-binding transpeptidase domain-containing protein [Oscillospiraceae bacterium]
MGKVNKKRSILITVLILCIFSLFLVNLFNIQVLGTQEDKSSAVSGVTVNVPAIRGEILDRNGYPLVTNRQVNKIVFTYPEFPKKYSERNRIIIELIRLFEKNGVEWNDELPIVIKGSQLAFAEDAENEISYLKSEAFLDLNYYATVENCFDAMVKKYDLSSYKLGEQRKIASVYYSMVKKGFNVGRDYEFATDVSGELVSALKERSDNFPGVDVQVSWEREYYDGTIAPHILGIVGPINEEEYESKKDEGYTINDVIGKSGIESAMEKYLRGKNGVKTITTDAQGNKTEEYTTEPEQGDTVILTIRRDLQKVAQDALEEGVKRLQIQTERSYRLSGSVVVMDTKNNECLAIASYPTYDNSTYQEDYDKLNSDPTKPLWNRALRSTYTPGSTIKPAVAMAALEEGIITGSSGVVCNGIYRHYADYQPGCTGYHGYQNVISAIYNSCNIFFYDAARRLGIEKLNRYFTMFGLGEPTGIELVESVGTVDSVEHRTSKGDLWTPGLTIQAGIGHGDNQFTPIQLCSYVSTIANRGTRYKAHIIRSVKTADLSKTVMESGTQILSKANFADENWDLVYKGMLLVGTKSYADFSAVPCKVAAKTGTTTVAKRVNGRMIETFNGFIIAFAPYDDPQIAVCVSVEGAGSGGSTAPIASAIMEYYFAEKDVTETQQPESSLLP